MRDAGEPDEEPQVCRACLRTGTALGPDGTCRDTGACQQIQPTLDAAGGPQ